MKKDLGHRITDQELAALEKRIAAEYKKSADELTDKIDDYFESFKKRDAETKALIGTVVNGRKYTEQDYKQWRLAQMGRGKRFEALRDRIAERMTDSNEVAAAYINDTTPGLYSLNRNYAAYTIEQQVGADVGFDLWDEQTVKRLIVEQPDLMPYYPPKRAVKRGIDLAWGKRQITAQVTSGILQGESIKHLSDRLQKNIPNMNRDSAIRAARTAVTGAQNAGRQDSYDAAVKMGIEMEKSWLATLDGRTRHDHAVADGQTVAEDKPFNVGGYKLMFPGDMASGAPGHLLYNCRCTTIAKVKGVDMSNARRRARDRGAGESVLVENMTYPEWAGWKQKKPQFISAETQEQAEKYAERFVSSYKSKYSGNVSFKGMSLDHQNKLNRVMGEVFDSYEIEPLANLTVMNFRESKWKRAVEDGIAGAYQWGGSGGSMFINQKIFASEKSVSEFEKKASDLLKTVLDGADTLLQKPGIKEVQRKYIEALKKSGVQCVSQGVGDFAEATIVHEAGHMLDDKLFRKIFKSDSFDLSASKEKFAPGISGYAISSEQEYIAESFTAYWYGKKDILDPELVKIFERAKK